MVDSDPMIKYLFVSKTTIDIETNASFACFLDHWFVIVSSAAMSPIVNTCQYIGVCFIDDPSIARHMWQLIDRVIQQVVLQQDDGGDPDVAPLDINVNFIMDS